MNYSRVVKRTTWLARSKQQKIGFLSVSQITKHTSNSDSMHQNELQDVKRWHRNTKLGSTTITKLIQYIAPFEARGM